MTAARRGERPSAGHGDGGLPEAGDLELAFLVAVDCGADEGWTAEESLGELASLVETAGGRVVGRLSQRRESIHPLTYVGTGKVAELKAAMAGAHSTMLVADDELSPKQQRSLEEALNVKVLDRSGVILDIFAQRAKTHEGRIQVELAQLEYQLPRLTRMWTHLSRMGGGIGTRRGPGETQLETDRRVLRQRIKKTRERVEEVRQRRETAARARERGLVPTTAVVGYTNAGKSTLLNALVGEEAAVAENKLFATLDPTTRRVKLGDGQKVLASDTVGFIHKLPHQLIEAFQATLEEVTRADVVLEVVDLSDPHAAEHRRTVRRVLDELGAGHKPRVVVLNKTDLVAEGESGEAEGAAREHRAGVVPPSSGGSILDRADSRVVWVSALTGDGLDSLRGAIADALAELWVEVDASLPYSSGELLARIREKGSVEVEYRDEDVLIKGRIPPFLVDALARESQLLLREEMPGAEG